MVSIMRALFAAIIFLSLPGCNDDSSEGFVHCSSQEKSGSGDAKSYCSPLIIKYQFDTADNGIVADLSANGLDLYVTGCSLVPGVSGSAIDCSSGGEANTAPTEFPSGESYNFAFQLADKGEMSVQFWMNYSQNAGSDYIASFDGSFAVYLKNNRLHFRPKWPADVEFSASFSPGVWYNIAVTFSGETARLYVDGMLVDEVSLISAIGAEYLNDQNMKFLPVYFEGHFRGAIDEFRLYDVEISQDVVVSNYNADRT